MFDKEIVLDSLQKMKAMLDLIKERTAAVKTANLFPSLEGGQVQISTTLVMKVTKVICH